MTQLVLADQQKSIDDFETIQAFLAQRGIRLERWLAEKPLSKQAQQDEILAAYQSYIEKLKAEGGYQAADVISVDDSTPMLEDIRAKFLREHTHSEDEVRFFVEGQGLFWFNKEQVFSVLCTAGDLISVPASTPHWFDLGRHNVKLTAIRLFTNPEGWIANYTNSKIDEKYNP